MSFLNSGDITAIRCPLVGGGGGGRKEKGRKRRGTDPRVGMVECANGMCSNKHWHNKIRGQKIKQAFKPTPARVKFQFSFFLSDLIHYLFFLFLIR